MIQATRSTLRRTATAMLGATLASTLIVGVAAAQADGVAPQIDEPPAGSELAGEPQAAAESTATLSRYEEVMAILSSDHLREIAMDWGLEGTPSASTVEPDLLYSDHLREISDDW